MKKIYPVEWLAFHPYKRIDEIDRYYTGIANKICAVLDEVEEQNLFQDEEASHHVALCLAGWFEDVISQTGIWMAFTAECKKRYGDWIPFYEPKDDYFPDEVNLEDVRFLLWHHLQYLYKGKRIIHPENPGIKLVAEKIYDLLADEYETAPENERLWQFLHPSDDEAGKFEYYREVLQWFHFSSYFNIENLEQMDEEMEELYTKFSEEEKMDCELEQVYSIQQSLMWRGRWGLLSLTSPEWLALVAAQTEGPKIWTEIKVRQDSFYLLKGEDEESLLVEDLCDGKGETVRVAKSSLRLKALENYRIGIDVLYCMLVFYRGIYLQVGTMIMRERDDKMEQLIEGMSASNARFKEKGLFHAFRKAANGKCFRFFQSKEEMFRFLTKDMNCSMEENNRFTNLNASNGILLMASPRNGLEVQTEFCSCVKSPDNPFYDQAKAEEDAIFFMIDPGVITYDLSCILQDRNMLPDAELNSLKGREYGKAFIRRHSRFLTDYFFRCCREKDLDEGAFASEDIEKHGGLSALFHNMKY